MGRIDLDVLNYKMPMMTYQVSAQEIIGMTMELWQLIRYFRFTA